MRRPSGKVNRNGELPAGTTLALQNEENGTRPLPLRHITRGECPQGGRKSGAVGYRRLAVWSALVAGLATIVWPAEAPAARRLRPIQPGAAVCPVSGPLDDGTCSQWATLNFVFTDGKGTLYIGSVAHNFGGEGERATIRGESRSFGTVVLDDDSVDFLHPGDVPSVEGTDFALIRIDRNRYGDVD